ncbi:DNA polymerase III subunit epsilon [Paraferrimonas sedimenticola]|uniref:DNA polymerase III subunit epsilon n=1 Tax=Paraferrimonas sedimenticola TaxID=375674 RepID=A0AA37RW00_9GAMM|nr:DNA polymerase III subunit epsilon [Paraferrimonas sedimenticola]GLP96196.1 DNA polymerase III subunit epsilon [Paraferrimonas sedimenticola]
MTQATFNRQIILDTETTGMNQASGPHYLGHKIIEIGAVEVINRRLTGRTYHQYINPQMAIDPEAIEVHGITDERVSAEPIFAQIADEFIEFIDGAELVAHNAPFDVGFMDHEFAQLNRGDILTANMCQITDSLDLAKKLFPGQKNNLDALCKRYGIDNSHRTLHGALLDAEILADVYLLMTGGQTKLNWAGEGANSDDTGIRRLNPARNPLKVIAASADELENHEKRLELFADKHGCLWREG